MSKPLFKCSDLSFHYPKSRSILDNINLSLDKGQCLALLGASGCGKSTFGQLACGFLKPTKGVIEYQFADDPKLTRLTPYRQKQMVFQDPSSALTPFYTPFRTIKDVLKLHFPDSEKSDDSCVKQTLELFGLESKLFHQKVEKLSGGEKQRLNLARAFSIHPELLILDEPISSCDPFLQKDILYLIKTTMKQKNLGIIVILHDLHHAEFLADDICLFHEGKIDSIESKDQFISNPKTDYARAFIDAFY